MGGKRRGAVMAAALVLALALTACAGREAGEMFALPEPPEDYRNLNAALNEVRSAIGGESIAPQSGGNTQTVQLQDLDADGVQESAVAFFRVAGAEKPLKIYIFRQQPDDSYEVDTVIEGVGNSIASVAYEDVGGSARKEVVASWQISGNDHTLGVYSLDDLEGIELLWVDSYTRFRVADLDADGQGEVAVLTLPGGEGGTARADYYDYDGAALALKSTAPLSAGVNEIKNLRTGNLQDGVPALFVASGFPETNEQVVDILAWQTDHLANLTLDSESLLSESTRRSYVAVGVGDINRDGVMEVPHPTLTKKAVGAMEDVWLLNWRQYDLQGKSYPLYTTYHNVTDGWYFQVPESWVDRLSIYRKDSFSADERGVVFALWQNSAQTPEPFLVLYKCTGTNQASRAAQNDRTFLFSDASSTYAYELMPQVWDTGLTEEQLRERFHVIRTEWSAEN